MPTDWLGDLQESLEELERGGLLRRLPAPELLERRADFHSNDYLGLSAHPQVVEAAREYVARCGLGSGGSRLIGGNKAVHVELEQRLASFKGRPAVLCFSAGYATAMGVVPTLLDDADDLIVVDRLAHACLVDAARAARARLRVFAHNDVGHLDSILKKASGRHKRILVVAESLYSMDGDFCPLAEIVEVKDRYGAWLLLDEAHSTGIHAPGGRGLAAQLGLEERVDIAMGTLGKALGCSGGFVAVDGVVRDYLLNRSRQFIFTTAPPGAVCAAALAALDVVSSPEGEELRKRLRDNSTSLRTALGVSADASPIIPLIIGDESAALAIAEALAQSGWRLPAIRYPTVARGAARLRITAKSFHSASEIAEVAAAVLGAMRSVVE